MEMSVFELVVATACLWGSGFTAVACGNSVKKGQLLRCAIGAVISNVLLFITLAILFVSPV